MNGEKADWTRRAIDVMTAWSADQPGNSSFAAKRVAAYAGDLEASMELTVGFINLTAMLLVELEGLSGSEMSTILQDIAKFTLELSPES